MAYRGRPLYLFVKDTKPGQVNDKAPPLRRAILTANLATEPCV